MKFSILFNFKMIWAATVQARICPTIQFYSWSRVKFATSALALASWRDAMLARSRYRHALMKNGVSRCILLNELFMSRGGGVVVVVVVIYCPVDDWWKQIYLNRTKNAFREWPLRRHCVVHGIVAPTVLILVRLASAQSNIWFVVGDVWRKRERETDKHIEWSYSWLFYCWYNLLYITVENTFHWSLEIRI